MAIILPFSGNSQPDTRQFQPAEPRSVSQRSPRESRDVNERDDEEDRNEKKVRRRAAEDDFRSLMTSLLNSPATRELETAESPSPPSSADGIPLLADQTRAQADGPGSDSAAAMTSASGDSVATAGLTANGPQSGPTGAAGESQSRMAAALRAATLQNQNQNQGTSSAAAGEQAQISARGQTAMEEVDSALPDSQTEAGVPSQESGSLFVADVSAGLNGTSGSLTQSSANVDLTLNGQLSGEMSPDTATTPLAADQLITTQPVETNFRTRAELELTGEVESMAEEEQVDSSGRITRSESTTGRPITDSSGPLGSDVPRPRQASSFGPPNSGAVVGEVRSEVLHRSSAGNRQENEPAEISPSVGADGLEQFWSAHSESRSGTGEQQRGFGRSEIFEPVVASGTVSTGAHSSFTGAISATGAGNSFGADSPTSLSSELRQPLSSQVSTAILEYIEREGVSGDRTLTVRLDPPELGEMVIELSKSDEGLAVRVTAREAVTMEMLLSRGGEIEQNLRSEKLDLTSLEFLSSGSMNDRSSQRDSSESTRNVLEFSQGRSGRRSGASGSGERGGVASPVKDSGHALTFRA